jgi:hypothetical protein
MLAVPVIFDPSMETMLALTTALTATEEVITLAPSEPDAIAAAGILCPYKVTLDEFSVTCALVEPCSATINGGIKLTFVVGDETITLLLLIASVEEPPPLAVDAIVNVPAPGVNVIFEPATSTPCFVTLEPSTNEQS